MHALCPCLLALGAVGSAYHLAQEDPDRSIADVLPTGGRALPTPPDKEITATSAGCAAFPVEPRTHSQTRRLRIY